MTEVWPVIRAQGGHKLVEWQTLGACRLAPSVRRTRGRTRLPGPEYQTAKGCLARMTNNSALPPYPTGVQGSFRRMVPALIGMPSFR